MLQVDNDSDILRSFAILTALWKDPKHFGIHNLCVDRLTHHHSLANISQVATSLIQMLLRDF